jgi:transcriptional regulator with XRE-family HTH domain
MARPQTVKIKSNPVAKALKAARDNKGLTQKQAAERLGVTQQCYNSWERGRTRPSADKAALLSKAFKIPKEVTEKHANVKTFRVPA